MITKAIEGSRSVLALRIAIALAGFGVLAASIFGIYVATQTPARAQGGLPATASDPRAVPDLRFQNAEGKPLTLSRFRGKVVLLNVWATWCVPCREEMPTLDRLQQKLGGPGFEVVALSIDREGPAAVRRFYEELGIRRLAIYVDPEMKTTSSLRTVGIPTTLLVNRDGRELWRKTGPAEWDAPQIIERLRRDTGVMPQPPR